MATLKNFFQFLLEHHPTFIQNELARFESSFGSLQDMIDSDSDEESEEFLPYTPSCISSDNETESKI